MKTSLQMKANKTGLNAIFDSLQFHATKPHHWQMLKKLKKSLLFLDRKVPVEKIGFLTLTFEPGTTDQEASREFSAIGRQLKAMFPGGWVRVVAFTERGVPHIHAVVIAANDIQSGWNDENYEEMRELNEQPWMLTELQEQRRKELGNMLTTNQNLKGLWRKLEMLISKRRRRKISKRVLAPRFELCPVRKNMKAVALYFSGNGEETATRPTSQPFEEEESPWKPSDSRERSDWIPGTLTKGTRIVAYSRNFPRVTFLEKGNAWIRFQEKLGVVTRGLKTPKEYMRHRYGPRWCFYVRYYVFYAVERQFGSDMRQWPSDEVGRIAERELANLDLWVQSGWPLEALKFAGLYSSPSLSNATSYDATVLDAMAPLLG